MNWTTIIQSFFTFATGFAAALLALKGNIEKANIGNERIYADKTDDLFNRSDKLTDERDDLKGQVLKLQSEVKALTKAVDSLKNEMKKDGI